MLKYKKLVLGELESNCYLVWDEKSKEGVIIDPGDEGDFIVEEVRALGIIPIFILATHGHFDHVLGALDVKLSFGIDFACSPKDKFLLDRQEQTVKHFLKKDLKIPNIKEIDRDLDSQDFFYLGEEKVEIIKTPGHTPGGVSFYSKEAGLLFTGDTIFAHSRGRTDLSYSSTKKIYESIKKLMELPGETIILPGHGEETSVGTERDMYKF